MERERGRERGGERDLYRRHTLPGRGQVEAKCEAREVMKAGLGAGIDFGGQSGRWPETKRGVEIRPVTR